MHNTPKDGNGKVNGTYMLWITSFQVAARTIRPGEWRYEIRRNMNFVIVSVYFAANSLTINHFRSGCPNG